MPKYIITCDYCGFKEEEYLYSALDTPRCTKCGDKKTHKQHKDEESGDVFGYFYKENNKK